MNVYLLVSLCVCLLLNMCMYMCVSRFLSSSMAMEKDRPYYDLGYLVWIIYHYLFTYSFIYLFLDSWFIRLSYLFVFFG